jgi:hypothetical protein
MLTPVEAGVQAREAFRPTIDNREVSAHAADCSVSSEPRKHVIFPSAKRHRCCMCIAALLRPSRLSQYSAPCITDATRSAHLERAVEAVWRSS